MQKLLALTEPQIQKLIFHYDNELRGCALTDSLAKINHDLPRVVNWYDVFTRFLASVMHVVTQSGIMPTDRRRLVLYAAMEFWKQSLAPLVSAEIKAPWIFNTFIAPMVEKEIPVLVGGVYDAAASVLTRFASQPIDVSADEAADTTFIPY